MVLGRGKCTPTRAKTVWEKDECSSTRRVVLGFCHSSSARVVLVICYSSSDPPRVPATSLRGIKHQDGCPTLRIRSSALTLVMRMAVSTRSSALDEVPGRLQSSLLWTRKLSSPPASKQSSGERCLRRARVWLRFLPAAATQRCCGQEPYLLYFARYDPRVPPSTRTRAGYSCPSGTRLLEFSSTLEKQVRYSCITRTRAKMVLEIEVYFYSC